MFQLHRGARLAIGLATTLAMPALAQSVQLDATMRSYATGDQVTGDAYRPYGQAVADFDGDGHLDVVHAHIASARFSICFGRGDGSFLAPIPYSAAGDMMDVVVGDWNRDGKPDLAFCQSNQGVDGNRVLVFLNNGDRRFAAEKRFVVGKGPTGIATADVDGDGDLDLITANWFWDEADVTVLENDGGGTFGKRADFAIPGTQPYKLAAGDLNGDGFADLAVSVRGGRPAVSLLFNDGTGAFSGLTQYQSPNTQSELPGIALADIDRDGDLDVFYATGEPSGNRGTIALFRNRGDGTLGAREQIAGTSSTVPAHEFAFADVTRDGWLDIFTVGANSSYGYTLIPSNGVGGFRAAKAFATGELSRAIDVADVDHDGDQDAIVTNLGSLNFTVHENEDGSFRAPVYYSTGGFTAESDAADLDRDGDIDLVTVDARVFTFKNRGDGTFQVSHVDPLLSVLNHPKLRDLNGDQYADLLMLMNTNIGVGAYDLYTALNQGDGTFGPISQWSLGSAGTGDCDTLDADEDGDLDVVITEYLGSPGDDGRKLYLLFNKGNGTFKPPVLFKDFTITKPERVVTGDINNDGHADIVAGNGDIVSWVGRGNGTFDGPYISDAGDTATKYLVVVDLNADGILDVATTGFGWGFADENLAVLRGFGDGEFTAPKTYYGMFSLQYSGVGGIDAADLDDDGQVDIVAGAYGAMNVSFFRNDGTGNLAPEQGLGTNANVLFTRAADFDGDGLLDVAANLSVVQPFPFPADSGITVLFGKHAPPQPVGRPRVLR